LNHGVILLHEGHRKNSPITITFYRLKFCVYSMFRLLHITSLLMWL